MRRALRAGGPAIALLACAVAALVLPAHAPLRSVVLFTAFQLGMIAIPGYVVWRLLDPRASGWVAFCLGLPVGYTLELGAYLLARAAGAPLASTLYPVAVVALPLLLRRARGPWRGEQRPRTPWWWPWWLVVATAWAMVWVSAYHFSATNLSRITTGDADETFSLSLVGELKNRVFGLEYPFVAGEPLRYHWGVFAHLADAAWVTGLPSIEILRVLAPTAMVVSLILALAGGATRVSGHWVAGPSALVLGFLFSLPDVFAWSPPSIPVLNYPLNPVWFYLSVSMGVPSTVIVGLLVVIALLLKPDGMARRPAVVLAVGMFAVTMIDKVAFVPVALGALGAATLSLVAGRRRIPRALVGLALGVVGVGVVLQFAVYSRASRGLHVDPWLTLLSRLDIISGGQAPGTTVAGRAVFVGTALVVLLAIPAAVTTLIPGGLRDARVAMLIGGWAGAIIPWLSVTDAVLTQHHFQYAANVPLALGAGWAAASLADRVSLRVPALALAGAAGAGALVVLLYTSVVGRIGGGPVPTLDGLVAGKAFLAPLLGWVAIGVAAVALIRRGPRARHTALALLLGVLVGGPGAVRPMADALKLRHAPLHSPSTTSVDPGIVAARWLRDHSRPRDVVATNVHCIGAQEAGCDRASFWISGYAERRVLLEGWAFIRFDAAAESSRLPFWRPEQLALNDEAFTSPSAASWRRLQERGVRWLFVDTTAPADVEGIMTGCPRAHRDDRYLVCGLGDTPANASAN